jgi:SAM-dependent methyltransferase
VSTKKAATVGEARIDTLVTVWNTQTRMPEHSPLFTLDRHRLHDEARLASQSPLTVVTPNAPWAYALSFLPNGDALSAGIWTVEVRVSVRTGQVGVGVLTADGAAFIKEAIVGPTPDPFRVRLRVPGGSRTGPLVVRNAGAIAATATVLSLSSRLEPPRPYLVDVVPRNVQAEAPPPNAGIVVFDDVAAESINIARMDWLSALDLDIRGKRVLDVGAGVGHFSRYYRERGASVVAVEGRAENVRVLRERYPDVPTHLADVQADDLSVYGRFDVVHCFGLLYHLDSPVIALRRMHDVCDGVLLLETMVCDSSAPLMMLADESSGANQALAGIGCRPTPAFVVTALNRVGFQHVYGTNEPPAHVDFRFEWRNNEDVGRDEHNLRCVFVAARHPVEKTSLVELL